MDRYVLDRLLALGALAAIVVTLLAVRPGGAPTSPRTLSVAGTGSTVGTPDILNVNLEVTSTASVANDALTQNNNSTSQLLDSLKSAGVQDKDVTTSGLSVIQNYDYYYNNNGQPKQYTASESVNVILRNLNTAGSIISSAANSAGDAIRINGMAAGFGDEGASLSAAARVKAIANAKTVALAMAKAAGASLGQVKTISDQTASTPVFQNISNGLSAGAASVPVSVGQQNFTVSVNVQYELS